MDRKEIVDVTCGLTFDEALALAQFLKRLAWSEIRACAVDEDEAYAIRDAVFKLQEGLKESGFNPR